MKNILEWFTKKKVLIISLFLSVAIYPFINLADEASSFKTEHAYETLIYILIIFVPIFILSMVNLFTKEVVFNAWKRFTALYSLIYTIIIIVSPRKCDYVPFCQDISMMSLVGIYIVISLILIVYSSLKK